MPDERLAYILSEMIYLRGFVLPIMTFAVLSLACSAADLVQRQRSTPTATAVGVLRPTFTATPQVEVTSIIVTPPAQDKPGVIIVPPGMDPESVLPELPTPSQTPVPTDTTLPLEVGTPSETAGSATPELSAETPAFPLTPATAEPTPTDTPVIPPTATLIPTPTATDTPLPTPTAFVRVVSGLVALRTGPGVQYPSISQLGPDVPVAIIGKSPDGDWLEICCISGESVWVATQHVTVINDISEIAQSLAEPPPSPTPTYTPTITPTPTPTPTATPYPFERALGPQFFPTNNEFVTIWAKLYIGDPPLEEAAPGYYLEVFFEGIPRPDTAGRPASKDVFEFSAPPGSGSRVEYNLKYEYRPPDPATLNAGSELTQLQLIGTGTWTVYVSDGAGAQLSDPVTFTTAPSNPNREIYIGWVRRR